MELEGNNCPIRLEALLITSKIFLMIIFIEHNFDIELYIREMIYLKSSMLKYESQNAKIHG
jgi:hypothetical protein